MCRRVVRWFHALDWFRRLRFIPLQSAEARALGLPESLNLSQMVLVDRGRQWRGWRATRRLLLRLPASYLLGACLAAAAIAGPGPRFAYGGAALFAALALSPVGNFAGDALYRLVARHRSCALDSPSRDAAAASPGHTPGNH